MSRLTDKRPPESAPTLPPLPAVDWQKIRRDAPEVLSFDYQGPNAPLPEADIVVITWTDAEWSAFDHVFCNSSQPRTREDTAWQKDWKQYSLDAPALKQGEKDFHLWGSYRMVQINRSKVLLFKSETHLSYPPYLSGLKTMVNAILRDTGCRYLYSIGTAGGVSNKDFLGNTIVTNGGHLKMTKSNNLPSDLNNKSYFCKNWFPSFDLIKDLETKLLYQMSHVATLNQYNALFSKLQQFFVGHPQQPPVDMTDITVNDLVNPPLDPTNLRFPRVTNCKDKPLLTTDYYYIAQSGDGKKYCILEMDDAVLAALAGNAGVSYAFVRNVSDPIVPTTTKAGKPIAQAICNEWSSLIYSTFGFYTSYNGALATWATIQAAAR
jgi:hypothetical protein